MVHKIDTPGAVASRFSAGNPFQGIAGTEVGAAWLNSIQAELVNLVLGAGGTPSKVDDGQVLQAVQDLAGAGLSANQLGRLNSSSPGGSPIAGEFRRMLDTVRAQVSTSTSGFSLPRSRATTYGLTFAGGTIPANYFAHGGTLVVGILGTFLPGSGNPTLGFSFKHNGTLFRGSGVATNNAYLWSNGTAGNHLINRLSCTSENDAPNPAPVPFRFDLKIESLGQLAKKPNAWIGAGSNDDGDGNTLITGRLSFRHVIEGFGYKPTVSRWITSTAYTKNGVWVNHHGLPYVCCAGHTSGASTEPGAGADWPKYWVTAEIGLEIHHYNQVDWTVEQDIALDISTAGQSDPAPPAAWSGSSVSYSLNGFISHGGAVYVCLESHTSSATEEPGDSTGANDGERYWAEVGNNQGDDVHIDRCFAWILGGSEGLGGLL